MNPLSVRRPPARRVFPAFACAFFATLLGAPAQAGINDFPVPATPLATGASVPPNLMLMMDNTQTMRQAVLRSGRVETIETPPDKGGWTVAMMPGDTDDTKNESNGLTATLEYNALAYDPFVEYRPWKNASGGYEGNIDPTNAPYDWSNAVGMGGVNLQAPESLAWRNRSEHSGKQLFYRLKEGSTAADAGDLSKYRVYRFTGLDTMEVCDAVRMGAKGYWDINENYPNAQGDHPFRGSYRVNDKKRAIYPWPVQLSTCKPGKEFIWTREDGSRLTRSVAEEWKNYANWFGYHRTRIKVAKAAVSEVFSGLNGNNYRVGLSMVYMGAGQNNYRLPIPVNNDGGLFRGKNRSAWFGAMTGLRIDTVTSTPLRSAFKSEGDYFAQRGGAGPWGPGKVEEQLACRQNYLLLASDGEWDINDPGTYITTDVDSQDGPEYMSPLTGKSFRHVARPPYRDGRAGTLADGAMHYWVNDLRPDMENIVPASKRDPAFWQHMVTFVISIGAQGKLDPVKDWPALKEGKLGWPDPWADIRHRIDDLFHTAVNGHGDFAVANNPQELALALEAALEAIDESTGSVSNLGFDGATLEAGGHGYVASYLSGQWSGDLTAYPITGQGMSGTPAWRASERVPQPDQRRIFTFGRPAGKTGEVRPMVAFPTLDQKEVLGEDVAAWVRGDRSLEGTDLRERNGVLGDIVHSSPLYLKAGGKAAVMAAANDGMLHVFDAGTGQEVFAYVPGLVDMAALKKNSLIKGFRHRYLVDGPLAGTRIGNGAEVRIVGTLGRGGRGLYGLSLDLAQPTRAPASWEYAGDDDMGHVLARPQFARVTGSEIGPGLPRRARQANAMQPASTDHVHAVLVPNGINSRSGKAALHVIDAADGRLIKKVVAADKGDDATGNGLSAVTAVDMDGDGVVDRAYAGDMRGNVWRFELAGPTNGWKAVRVFTARRASKPRPITGGIGVAFHPATLKPWVFFGTGSYITLEDAADTTLEGWYGMEDDGGAKPVAQNQLRQRELVSGGKESSGGLPTRTFRNAEAGDMKGKRGWWMNLQARGQAAEGERMLGDQQIIGGTILVAASVVPSGGGCGGRGRGYLNAVDAFTGGATSRPFFDINGDGKVDAGDTVDGTAVGSLDLGLGMITDPSTLLGKLTGPPGGTEGGALSQLCANGVSGTTGCVPIDLAAGGRYHGRMAWREMLLE